MAKTRKDSRGRSLRKGETQRSDGRYAYAYEDEEGRHYIYDRDLNLLRAKEEQIKKDLAAGLRVSKASAITLNEEFDLYISTKRNIRPSTRVVYTNIYDCHVRDTLGKMNIAKIRHSDILKLYTRLGENLSDGSISVLHAVLHSVFEFAIDDDLILKNPTRNAYGKIKQNSNKEAKKRHALSIEQQRDWLSFIKTSKYSWYWPLFVVLLGTGCRIGEVLGLRWEDIDFDKMVVNINHSIKYYSVGTDDMSDRTARWRVHRPKTKSGIRVLPMLSCVKEAFELCRNETDKYGNKDYEIDGMTGFVFCRSQVIPTVMTINRNIRKSIKAYNELEMKKASEEKREANLLPDFTCHVFRHSYCTLICENGTPIKTVEYLMGHKEISTTMDVYAEATEEKNRASVEALEKIYKNLTQEDV